MSLAGARLGYGQAWLADGFACWPAGESTVAELGPAEASFAAERLAVVAETVSAAAVAAAAVAAAVHSYWVIGYACAAVLVGYNAEVHSVAVPTHVLVAAAVVAAADVAIGELLVGAGTAFEDYGTEQWVILG